MHTLSTPQSAREFVWDARVRGKTVGIVPTMGALHEGHLSLIRKSRWTCDVTVATIFVNPTQFGEGEDFDRYPRTLERDLELLQGEGVASVFVPEASSMYPKGYSTFVDPPEVSLSLEGSFRPDHFRGVATIVLKLFLAVPATHAFFGRKDYQQLKVIEAMASDLGVGIEIVGCETVRESDGLALSSRNRYLDRGERERARLISRSLREVTELFEAGERNVEKLETSMRSYLLGHGVLSEDAPGVDRIDYAVVVEAERLAPISEVDRPAVALIAAHVGKTRLIDNTIISAVGQD